MNKTTQALLDKICELQHELTLAKQTATQQGEFATMWRDKCQELQQKPRDNDESLKTFEH